MTHHADPLPADPLSAGRVALVFGAAIAILAAATVYVIVRRNCGPDPLATHWGIDSRPNGSMSYRTFALLSLAIPGGALLIALAVAGIGRDPFTQRAAGTAAVAGVAFFAVVTVTTIEANVGKATWTDARSVGWWVALAAGAALIVGAVLGWRLAGAIAPHAAPPPAPITRATTYAGPTRWMGRATSLPLAALATACLLASALLFVTASRWFPVVLLVAGVAALPFIEVHATVDERGLRVALAPWRWPVKTVPLSKIATADAIDVRPMRWGGWGYRWMPGVTAVVIRAGEGLKIGRANGRTFVVTVDDAQQAAVVLNHLLVSHADGR